MRFDFRNTLTLILVTIVMGACVHLRFDFRKTLHETLVQIHLDVYMHFIMILISEILYKTLTLEICQ